MILPANSQIPAARGNTTYVRYIATGGMTFGSALAITISWSLHKSVFWAIVHGILSWLYVIYYVLAY
ncbi:MAG: hypothetical protein ACLFUU_10825 [Desulfobacteraceae bacterium]